MPLETGATTALVYAAEVPAATLVLGHGAGAGQRHPFMVTFARAISALGIDVVTFNFPYTEAGRRVPDRGAVLEDCFRRVIEVVSIRPAPARRRLFIGGKSMGGRIATQIAAAGHELRCDGLVLLGYPLHPPGRPDQLRDKHLPAVGRPMLFVQGSRDAFGTPAELAPVVSRLQPPSTLHVVEGGDHSFNLSKRDPAKQAAVYDEVQRTIVEWIGGIIGTGSRDTRR